MAGSNNCRTFENCLRELLLNSLNSKATAIAVRIDARKGRIMVVDNGCGIPKNTMLRLGENGHGKSKNIGTTQANISMTSGKSLLRIREYSLLLVIMSRAQSCSHTYGKFFSNGRIPEMRKIENRPAHGTTVSVYVSENICQSDCTFDLYAIRCIIIYLALVNRQVSFSVRDDARQSIILRIGKNQTSTQLLRVLCENPMDRDQFRHGKILIVKNMKMEIFWGVNCAERKKIQTILMNLRPVNCPLLEDSMIKTVKNMQLDGIDVGGNKIFFLLYIQSPETEYTFSIRDNQRIVEFHQINNIVKSIGKFVFKTTSQESVLSKLLNYRPIVPPLIFQSTRQVLGAKRKRSFLHKEIKLKEKKHADLLAKRRKNMPSSFIEQDDFYPQTMEKECGDNALTILPNARNDENLSIKHQKYDNHDISWISQRCIEKSDKDSSMIHTRIEEPPNRIRQEQEFNGDIDDYSQWSDWNYEPDVRDEKNESTIIHKRFKFLPLKLHTLLPRRNVKLTTRGPTDDIFFENINFNNRHQNLVVRDCISCPTEFTLKLQSLQAMKVLNQFNQEFIIASTKQDDKELLVIIDQHAMHERIHYENLLRAYKRDTKNQQLISVILRRPIAIIDFSSEACNVLSTNRNLLMQYGLTLKHRNVNTLLIYTVPRCFLKKTLKPDDTILEIAVRKLLNEFLEDLINGGFKKIIPFTIHEAIASEACRGSIKFGDPLTPEQCDVLVSCWKETDVPNRCAHGRPSVIPLLEISTHKRLQNKVTSKISIHKLAKSKYFNHDTGIKKKNLHN